MSNFSTTAATKKGAEDVLQAALTILTNNGFAIVTRDETTAELTGPGLNSTRQNPLLGATKIHLELQGQQFKLDAELGGVDSMRRFLMRFPLLLGLSLGLLFALSSGFMFGRQFGIGFGVPWAQGWTWFLLAVGMAMIPVSPWLVLSPLMSNMVRTRTQNALVTLVQNSIRLPKGAL
jgi:hypothetical protein